jgi:hypothetical protein
MSDRGPILITGCSTGFGSRGFDAFLRTQIKAPSTDI